eukprot:TRINITY_DN16630_c0_g1_i12.p1 TRINITY_DN16630_c0_g1~~TRINITY_DN16630_c0_g1_i12.p1  ORF type:complete len:236 (+),score=25.60 TRINITY_DN16630_c0_g1_i12:254-961(+)
MNFQPSSYESVRVLVCGDSGVGKTCLVHGLCHGGPPGNTAWTVGCHCGLMLHHAENGDQYWIELCDVGAQKKHQRCRHLFFEQPFDGIIAVHDLSNRKSFNNLKSWLREIEETFETTNSNFSIRIEKDSPQTTATSSLPKSAEVRFSDVPLLYVGTKQDTCDGGVPGSVYGMEAEFVHLSLSQTISEADQARFSAFMNLIIKRKFSRPQSPRARAGSITNLTMRQTRRMSHDVVI